MSQKRVSVGEEGEGHSIPCRGYEDRKSAGANSGESGASFTLYQFSSRWHLCARKILYALHPISQKFPQRYL